MATGLCLLAVGAQPRAAATARLVGIFGRVSQWRGAVDAGRVAAAVALWGESAVVGTGS